MALYTFITDREIGYDGHIQSFNLYGRYVCHRQDEHITVGQSQDPVPPLHANFSAVSPYNVAVVDEEGGIMLFDALKHGPDRLLKEWQGHSNAIFDVDWVPQETNRLVTCGGDQTVTLWDTEHEIKVLVMKGHKSSVKTVQYLYNNNAVLASGARDGRILLWDTRVTKKGDALGPVNVITNAHRGPTTIARRQSDMDSQHSVTALVFQDENTLISAGSADGKIQLWDLRKNYCILKNTPIPKQSISYCGNSIRNHGYSGLVLDATRTRLFANCLDHTIYEFDLCSSKTTAIALFQGHKNSTFYVRSSLSSDNRFLITGSSDSNAYIYSVDEPKHAPCVLRGHSEEVSFGQWHPCDPGILVTFSDDCRFRTWRLTNDSDSSSNRHDLVGYADLTNTGCAASHSMEIFSPSKKIRSVCQRHSFMLSPAAKMAISHLSHSTTATGSFTAYYRSLSKRQKSYPMKIASGLPTPKKLTVTPLKAGRGIANMTTSAVASAAKRRLYDESDHTPVAVTKKQRNDSSNKAETSDEGIRQTVSLPDIHVVSNARAGQRCPLLANVPNYVVDGSSPRVLVLDNRPTPSPVRPANWLHTLSSQRKRLSEINGDDMVPAVTPPMPVGVTSPGTAIVNSSTSVTPQISKGSSKGSSQKSKAAAVKNILTYFRPQSSQ